MAPRKEATRALDAALVVVLLLSLAWFWSSRVATPITKYTISGWDLFLYFEPMYDYIGSAFRAARVPLWNPHQGCGEPLLGVLQGGVFYPARALLLFLDTPQAMAWSAVIHIGISLLATFAFMRSMGASAWAAATAAVTFTYGVIASMINQPATFLEPGVWLPLAAFAIHRVTSTNQWRYVALASATIAAPVLAGGYQVALYAAYGVVAVCLGLWLDPATRTAAGSVRSIALLTLCALLAIALSAPQWATTLLWAPETLRPAEQLDPSRVDPFLTPPIVVLETLLGRRDVLTSMFLPPAILTLALVGSVAGPRMMVPVVALSIASLALSLGPTMPWFNLYYALPGFAFFRAPTRLHYLVMFGAAMSAGFGVDVLRRRASRRRWFVNVFIGAVVAVATLSYVLTPARNPMKRITAPLDRYDAVSASATALIGLLSPTLVGPSALVASAATLWRSRTTDSVLPYSPESATIPRHASTYKALAGRSILARTMTAATGAHWVLPAFMVKKAMLNGFSALDDYEPLAQKRLVHYLSSMIYGDAGRENEMRMLSYILIEKPFARPRLLDLASVRFIVAPAGRFNPLVDQSPAPYRERHDIVASIDRGKIRIFENPAALPRAYLVPVVKHADNDDEALRSIADPAFVPTREVVVVDAPPLAGDGDADPVGDSATITSYEPERVTIATSSSGPRVLVLTDAFAPGWAATVDGRDVPVWRANYLFRGVSVPKGSHEVTFTYRAPGYRGGMTVAWCALAVLLGVPLATRRMGRSTQGAPP